MQPLATTLTRESVLSAIDEHDRLGRDRFLDRYGFKEARDYFLSRDGRAYESKAVAGVAYGYVAGATLTSSDFTGGSGLADVLRALGFHVTGVADWTWPELVLACALLDQDGWRRTIRAHEPEVVALSRFLRDRNPELLISPTFRSANSVQRKLEDLRTVHPTYTGKPTRGGRMTEQVALSFLAEPARMRAVAASLRSQAELMETPPDGDDELDSDGGVSPTEVVAAIEGGVSRRTVAQRERDPKLRRAKIEDVRRRCKPVACEVCAFDFRSTYGPHGDGYIQVHHVIPLHFSGEVTTRLEDLALLCANCHAMIHRRHPMEDAERTSLSD